ncbi:MAG TPA: ABC transporter permease [Candidatus Limnocylindrales bacterium]|nr:ABC transporter permease [Candidatus Limnocylindrales bacterium]
MTSPARELAGAIALGRLIPPGSLGTRRARYLFERSVYLYRRQWLMIASGFLEPLFYLVAVGFGVGALVGSLPGPDGQPIPYQVFVAPALLGSSMMNGAITEVMFNAYGKLRWEKVYDAVLATPLGVGDIALGEIAWAIFRGGLYAVGFVAVMVVLGLLRSPLAILAIPAALLEGFAFAAVGMAATTFLRSWQDFDLIQVVLQPMFLFSGTFFPLAFYPAPLQVVVQLTPLYHAVALLRDLSLGTLDPGILVHVVYLAGLGLIGLVVVSRRLDRLLLH